MANDILSLFYGKALESRGSLSPLGPLVYPPQHTETGASQAKLTKPQDS